MTTDNQLTNCLREGLSLLQGISNALQPFSVYGAHYNNTGFVKHRNGFEGFDYEGAKYHF